MRYQRLVTTRARARANESKRIANQTRIAKYMERRCVRRMAVFIARVRVILPEKGPAVFIFLATRGVGRGEVRKSGANGGFKCVYAQGSSNYSLAPDARPLSSIICALISIRASVISPGYQSTQLINCRHARTWGFMVQKCGAAMARAGVRVYRP